MERQATCKDRLPREYNRVKSDLLRVTGHIRPDKKWLSEQDMPVDVSERVDQWLEYLLEISPAGEYTRGVKVSSGLVPVRVLMSTGGPEDGFILGVRSSYVRGGSSPFYRHGETYGHTQNQIVEVYYFFSDWFDAAHIKVRAGSKFESVLIDLFGPYVENMELEEDES
jgi:hypothetical protein